MPTTAASLSLSRPLAGPVTAARMVLVPVGFVPVSLIGASAFGVAGLRMLSATILVPAVVVLATVLAHHPQLRRLVAVSLLCGIPATALYDLFRFDFLGLGLMSNDPIPRIGAALHLQPAWFFGYLWRYLGNGTGLAVAFLALGLRGPKAGTLFGLFVCSGLIATLVLAPHGQEMLFPLTPATLVMAIGGHIIYGATLGVLAERRLSERLCGFATAGAL